MYTYRIGGTAGILAWSVKGASRYGAGHPADVGGPHASLIGLTRRLKGLWKRMSSYPMHLVYVQFSTGSKHKKNNK